MDNLTLIESFSEFKDDIDVIQVAGLLLLQLQGLSARDCQMHVTASSRRYVVVCAERVRDRRGMKDSCVLLTSTVLIPFDSV